MEFSIIKRFWFVNEIYIHTMYNDTISITQILYVYVYISLKNIALKDRLKRHVEILFIIISYQTVVNWNEPILYII